MSDTGGQADKGDPEADAGDSELARGRTRFIEHQARGEDDADKLRRGDRLGYVERHPEPAPSFSIRLAPTVKAITAKSPPSVFGSGTA